VKPVGTIFDAPVTRDVVFDGEGAADHSEARQIAFDWLHDAERVPTVPA
jgi:hypothetical protein